MDPISRSLDGIRAECAGAAAAGALADYIPQLARADPGLFAIALASLDGEVYCAGDADAPLTIQSISKPFVYALALEDLGVDAVAKRVGAEPSGEPFNAISLEPGTGRPVNPLVNAGAILVTSLVAGDRFARIHECLEAFAGRRLDVDEAVFASERETGDRNRAIAHLMRAAGSLRCGVDEVIDAYFRQCSVLVTARDLAVMAATLANGGRNPQTGRLVVREETARHVLSVMTMCGMYDAAGHWMLRVGLPAKSGVAGGVLAVSPGQFGIGLFSPPLDARGNSVSGVLACEVLAERFGLHLLHDPAAEARSAKVQAHSPAPRSARRRPRAERAVLEREAGSISVLTLRGDIDFAAAELAMITTHGISGGWLVLDLHGVTRLHTVAGGLVTAITNELSGRGTTVAVAAAREGGFGSLDAALEWCEDELVGVRSTPVPLIEHDLLAELEPDLRDHVIARCTPRRLAPGTAALAGDDVVFAVQSGRVGLFAGDDARVSTGAGGVVSRLDAPAARAQVETTGAAWSRGALAALEAERPEAVVALWRSLAALTVG